MKPFSRFLKDSCVGAALISVSNLLKIEISAYRGNCLYVLELCLLLYTGFLWLSTDAYLIDILEFHFFMYIQK